MIAGKNDEFGIPSSPQPGGEAPRVPVSAAERQEERQANVPALYKTTLERLACELALGMQEPEVIFTTYGYTAEAAHALLETKSFTDTINRISGELRENGISFRSKMRAVAEDLIPHAYDMATDPLQSGAVRADIIKWAGKMAGFEPPPAKGVVEGGGGGFNLSITFAGQAPTQIVGAHVPAVIEHNQEA